MFTPDKPPVGRAGFGPRSVHEALTGEHLACTPTERHMFGSFFCRGPLTPEQTSLTPLTPTKNRGSRFATNVFYAHGARPARETLTFSRWQGRSLALTAIGNG